MLSTALAALANPALPDPIPRETPGGRPVAAPEVRGQAFCQLIERFPTDRLPTTGGVNAQVVVTIPMATLEGRLAASQVLGSDLEVSPSAARRLACAAGVIPAILDGRSQVLDLGRRRRLHTKAQRLALAIQQQGYCAAEGCDLPATWADAHHLTAWSAGGKTTTTDGVLLCPRHHTHAHQREHRPSPDSPTAPSASTDGARQPGARRERPTAHLVLDYVQPLLP